MKEGEEKKKLETIRARKLLSPIFSNEMAHKGSNDVQAEIGTSRRVGINRDTDRLRNG